MRIVELTLNNFRGIRKCTLHPGKHAVLLGPNNSGKTAILEGLNLVLNPEIGSYRASIDENDFYRRAYVARDLGEVDGGVVAVAPATRAQVPLNVDHPADPARADAEPPPSAQPTPTVRIVVVIADLSADDQRFFKDFLVAWDDSSKRVHEADDTDADPFEGREVAIRLVFEAWYDVAEDDFAQKSYFQRDVRVGRAECPTATREHKRRIGFLIYRDYRALSRPITLQDATLFARLLESQGAMPKRFEEVLDGLETALDALTEEEGLAGLVANYASELENILPLSSGASASLRFRLTDRTRKELRTAAQLYVDGAESMPIQKLGAGTRSIATLAMLMLIMRRRGRGILALEEPETYLFPHAQRRVIDECLSVATQALITTHSPYVLERIQSDDVLRIERRNDGEVMVTPLPALKAKGQNLYARKLRDGLGEALLGKAVLLVEGDSDRAWVLGASRVLHGQDAGGRRLEAFDLAGCAVVSADSNGMKEMATFFAGAGLHVACTLDSTKDSSVVDGLTSQGTRVYVLRDRGLESLLARTLPIELQRSALVDSPVSRVAPKAAADVQEMPDNQVRKEFKSFLQSNKGTIALHEWLVSCLLPETVPKPLRDIIEGHEKAFRWGEAGALRVELE